jgi:methylated-DNA-[protein]-cysteine S-methyltransferase
MKTPIGPLSARMKGNKVVALDFSDGAVPEPLAARLRAYFGGDLAALDEIEVEFERGTPFQLLVWNELQRIPVGTTISYAELARRIGRPKAVRAVGLANGQNPVALVVPCHRVIGKDGSLTGYGGGLDKKRWLLEHESASLFQLPGSGKPGAKSKATILE